MLLGAKDFNVVRRALRDAFQNVDARLADRLGTSEVEDQSGSTATAMFIQNDMLIIAHVGDSSLVLTRSGKSEVLANPHQPYETSTMSLLEVRRVRDAGGWVTNGRICDDIAVSCAFVDIRFKTKKKEMLKQGLAEGRWSQKFISRDQFRGDLIIACPEVYPVALGSDAEFILLASDGLWDYMSRLYTASTFSPRHLVVVILGAMSAYQFTPAEVAHVWPHLLQCRKHNCCTQEFFLYGTTVMTKFGNLTCLICSSEAVSFVRKELSQHGDVQLACESLAKAALHCDCRFRENGMRRSSCRTDRIFSMSGDKLLLQLV
ncbi:phosphatase 2C 57-like protein [Drosera capensis]